MKRASPIWILAFVVTCIAATPAQDFHGWQAQNVPGVVLESVKESERGITFAFKNVSGKALMGYSVCFKHPDASDFTSCQDSNSFSTGHILLAPGKSDELTIDTQEANQYSNRIVRIAAAIFEDGTSQGIQFDISAIEMRVLGQALEAYRLSGILSTLEEPTDADTNRLAVKVGPAPDEGPYFYSEFSRMKVPGLEIPDFQKLDKHLRYAFYAGAVGVRRKMLGSLDALRELPASSTDLQRVSRPAAVSGLKDHLRGQSSQLIDYCKRIQGGRAK